MIKLELFKNKELITTLFGTKEVYFYLFNNIKYYFDKYVLLINNLEEKIMIDFKNKMITIYLIQEHKKIKLPINIIKNCTNNNLIEIVYSIIGNEVEINKIVISEK